MDVRPVSRLYHMGNHPPYRHGNQDMSGGHAMVTGARHLEAAVCVSVPHEPISVRVARHAFAAELAAARVSPRERDDGLLVLSELVSNAIKHAAPLPDGSIAVRWQISDDLLHIEITDGGATTQPEANVAARSALGGRGLDIVRTVSSDWGVTEDGATVTVTVWADIPRAPLHENAHPRIAGTAQ